MSSLSQKGNGAQSQTERGINPYRKENQLRPKRRRKQRKRDRDLAGIDFEIRNSFIQVFEFPPRWEKSEMWRADAKIESRGTKKIYGTLLENPKGKQNLLGFVCMQMFMIGGVGLKQLQEEIEAELRNLSQRDFSLGISIEV